ncbi:hypothetical protein SISSUDRAFT_1055139 [Sistotremastrum suecicum HHB10207 ss-3]|uniref:Uncharacterized protein n=1 Tax=Sistotremastrum suecicum HHB10207 ss-3 TaxID=1314776 RepID=A0A165Y0T4_9AGAM|nr:hypothetical protein SISSUDRAFT_1055139 [Sistotremastrum suecicum HHB10207 ss-3]
MAYMSDTKSLISQECNDEHQAHRREWLFKLPKIEAKLGEKLPARFGTKRGFSGDV